MMFNLTIPERWLRVPDWLKHAGAEHVVLAVAVALWAVATTWSVLHGYSVSYGDAESHLNISKRVIHSLTPGFAQLGGIWLPLPHLLMLPFVYFDPLWRTGLAGAIVSGAAYVLTARYLLRTTRLLTGSTGAGAVAAVVFLTNPNVLYMATTPMTELVLIVFFTLSTYYFISYLKNRDDIFSLILAALWSFCAVLSRYDAWFLVMFEAGVLVLVNLPWAAVPKRLRDIRAGWSGERWGRLQGRLILFTALAFFGIFLWLSWDALILGDPLYFKNSEFSAESQQKAWDARGELETKHNLPLSALVYSVTAMSNVGVFVSLLGLAGLCYYLADQRDKNRLWVAVVFAVPFTFNVVSMFLGQSVIFIPHVTPARYEWHLFNVRYGVMMVPFAAFLVGYLALRLKNPGRAALAALLLGQVGLYLVGYSKVISFEDGVRGLSSATAKTPDAQYWLERNYRGGLVLTDDFARTISIIRSPIRMQDDIYVGNKPYWEESLERPELRAEWVIMQENDSVWRALWANPAGQAHLFKYYVKAYTSPQVLIFKRNHDVPVEE